MSRKRSGNGGNAARDPRNNLVAQEALLAAGIHKKKCTGFLHFDGVEIDVHLFRQQKGNQSTGLQSRCDLCNRLYFSIIQKPIKRLAAITIWAFTTKNNTFLDSIPNSLEDGIQKTYEHWLENPCSVVNCEYLHYHSDYRQTAAFLTKYWSGREREDKDSTITDFETELIYPAPTFMHDLQTWAGANGILKNVVDHNLIWQWWIEQFPQDTAFDSAEQRFHERASDLKNLPAHPIHHFPWGAGNILSTTQGHSLPGFNQVKSSYRNLPRSSSSDNRVYGYLVEGDRLAMKAFSKKCKEMGMSLGHHPAPLRWLGKDDPINGLAQPLKENIIQRDSLAALHKIALEDPDSSGNFVSWQIRTVVIQLGKQRASFEKFTTTLEAKVEEYLDSLVKDIDLNQGKMLQEHLKRADPGKTDTVYQRRFVKVKSWLESRPAHVNQNNV